MIESMSGGDQKQFITNDRLPILQNIRISSVKNSSNAEVETVVSDDNTESTTGTISNIEIVANDEILNVLRSTTEQGYELYVVYTLERDGNEDKEVLINQSEIDTSDNKEEKDEKGKNDDNNEDVNESNEKDESEEE